MIPSLCQLQSYYKTHQEIHLYHYLITYFGSGFESHMSQPGILRAYPWQYSDRHMLSQG